MTSQKPSKLAVRSRYVIGMLTYAQTEYVSDTVLTASPLELIRILYESALISVEAAIEHLRSGDIVARGQAITRAIDSIHELRSSLRSDVQPELTSSLAELYGYMQHRLLHAHARKSEDALQEVSRILKPLYEGWRGVMAQLGGALPNQAEPEAGESHTYEQNPYAMLSLEPPAAARTWSI